MAPGGTGRSRGIIIPLNLTLHSEAKVYWNEKFEGKDQKLLWILQKISLEENLFNSPSSSICICIWTVINLQISYNTLVSI